ncbi:hypothetical protein IACHDJAJ_00017 [Aeromonas phage vB_AdhS_TS3]|nr:hypothetical protein IACHDJAJ_00017 [Aeromonas phage vB_AdhS_TS3]
MTIKSTPHYYIEVKLPKGGNVEGLIDLIWDRVDRDMIEDMEWDEKFLYINPANDVSIHVARMLDKLVYEVAAEFGYKLEGC